MGKSKKNNAKKINFKEVIKPPINKLGLNFLFGRYKQEMVFRDFPIDGNITSDYAVQQV